MEENDKNYATNYFTMKKSIDIDEIIWLKTTIEAEKRGISIDDLVKQALEVFLGMDTKKI